MNSNALRCMQISKTLLRMSGPHSRKCWSWHWRPHSSFKRKYPFASTCTHLKHGPAGPLKQKKRNSAFSPSWTASIWTLLSHRNASQSFFFFFFRSSKFSEHWYCESIGERINRVLVCFNTIHLSKEAFRWLIGWGMQRDLQSKY